MIIKESLQFNNMTVLVCNMFDDAIITNTLSTNIGEFSRDEFTVEKSKRCFSEPTTRNIVIKKSNLPNEIKEVKFV